MVNKLIKAYLNKYEHREYVYLIFGKLFRDVAGLGPYLNEKARKELHSQYSIPLKDQKEPFENSDPSTPPDSPGSPTRIFENHFASPVDDIIKPSSMREEIKGAANYAPVIFTEDTRPEKLNTEDALLVCDNILKTMREKLLYMPLSMRYLFKLLSRLVLQFVLLMLFAQAGGRIATSSLCAESSWTCCSRNGGCTRWCDRRRTG